MMVAPLELLDDPHEWAAFGRASANDPQVWESSVVIEGMHCAACSVTVEDALRQVPGVLSAQVSAASQRARVQWVPAEVKPSDLDAGRATRRLPCVARQRFICQ